MQKIHHNNKPKKSLKLNLTFFLEFALQIFMHFLHNFETCEPGVYFCCLIDDSSELFFCFLICNLSLFFEI